MKKYFVIFCGGSGSGKSFYEKTLSENDYFKLISHTTRNLRIKDNEKHGEHYYFVTKEEFDNTEMVESITIHGNNYGLSKFEVLRQDGNKVLVAEANGVKQTLNFINNDQDMIDYIPIVVLLDIEYEERKQNMENRGDSEENILKRLNDENIVGDFYNLGLEADIIIKNRVNIMEVINNYIKELETNNIDL